VRGSASPFFLKKKQGGAERRTPGIADAIKEKSFRSQIPRTSSATGREEGPTPTGVGSERLSSRLKLLQNFEKN